MRKGILAGGNFIIDHVKLINHYPEQDMLADIRSETSSNGGGPYNVLKDLSAMRVDYPLSAAGLVGKDANGDWILRDCRAAGIDTAQLRQTERAPTSYTDAMTVMGTGRRTFFHQRGANALLSEADFDFSSSTARVFHLGYLMLLDEMDRLLPDGSTPAARVLAKAREAGLITTVDIVAGPVSSGMVSGTTAMLAPTAALASASWTSSALARASAGWALSMDSAEVSSSMPPPT